MEITEVVLDYSDLEEAVMQFIYKKYQIDVKSIEIQEFDTDNLSFFIFKLNNKK